MVPEEKWPVLRRHEQAAQWLKVWTDLGRAARTVDAYARGLAEFLDVCERNGVDPVAASRADVAVFVRELTSRPSRHGVNVVAIDSGSGLSNATLQQRLVPVRLFFDYLIEEGVRGSNPVGRGRYTPGRRFGGQQRGLVPRMTKLPWIPTEAQWLALLAAFRAEPRRNRLMLALAYDAALRREELCALRTDDLDPGRRMLRVRASGSAVHSVQTDGAEAVLKVTAAGPGQIDARRELGFYQTMADKVAVSTPRLLQYADNDELTALLLSAHAPAPPARQWDLTAWLAVGRQLAVLHSTPIPDQRSWLATPWLQQILDRPPVDTAEGYWSSTDAADKIGAVLAEPAALAAAMALTGACFVHGDCHVGNLLGDGDRLVWADWQVVGVGSPAVDLAFLWSRANADGADLPYAAMMREYAAHRPCDIGALHLSTIAAELGILLFGWPEYAAHLRQTERDRLTRRLLQVLEDWRVQTA
jgi:site-specific recombinase XerD